MLARVAENLYWLGRYLERADNAVRMVDVNQSIAVETMGDGASLETVVYALDAVSAFEEAREERPELTLEDYLVFSPDSPVSTWSNISIARNLARELREHISREVFEEINSLYLTFGRQSADRIKQAIAVVRQSIPTALGLFEHTVLRTEGTRWFRMGVFLERADMTSRIVDVKYFVTLPPGQSVGSPWDHSQWREVLRSASALEAYRKSHHGLMQVEGVVDMLVFEPDFPRSLVHCVDQMIIEFREATEGAPAGNTVSVMKELVSLQLDLKAANADRVLADGMHQFIERFQRRLARINELVTNDVFHLNRATAR